MNQILIENPFKISLWHFSTHPNSIPVKLFLVKDDCTPPVVHLLPLLQRFSLFLIFFHLLFHVCFSNGVEDFKGGVPRKVTEGYGGLTSKRKMSEQCFLIVAAIGKLRTNFNKGGQVRLRRKFCPDQAQVSMST